MKRIKWRILSLLLYGYFPLQKIHQFLLSLKKGKNETKVANVDDYLIILARKTKETEKCGVFISTNDKELKQKALRYDIRTIYLRQKKFLELSA